MKSCTPKIAVVMPVYNSEMYVSEAVQSVLDQTISDLELIIIDDGSTDRSLEIVSRFTDPRLRVIQLDSHRGLAAALNAGIGESRSEFIARMDADDISMPRRFERQLYFLETHPEVSICGAWMREFGSRCGLSCPPSNPEHVRAGMFFGWVMNHPTLMMRHSFLERFGLIYKEEFCEDFEFLMRASQVGQLANVPEFLMQYRNHNEQFSVVYREQQQKALGGLLVSQLHFLVPEVTHEEEILHVILAHASVPISQFKRAGEWLLHLDCANRKRKRYDIEYFRRGLSKWWFRAHTMQAAAGGFDVLGSYWSSPFAGMRGVGIYNHVVMSAKCAIKRPTPLLWDSCRRVVEKLRVGMFR